MNKRDVFINAMQAGEYRRKAWVISAFSLIQEGPDDWKKEPYPWRLVQTPSGHFYVSPDDTSKLLKIDDAVPKDPPYNAREGIIIGKADIPNAQDGTKTTYGNLLVNWTVIVGAMGPKLPYQTGDISPKKLEVLILPKLVDDPPLDDTSPFNPDVIYVKEYLRFCDAMFYLPSFMQLFVPAASEKALTAPPGIKEFKKKLLEEYKDKLDDPATIARIDKALIDYDTQYLKGDSSEGFLSKKARTTVRRKLFLMMGAEGGFGDGLKVDLVKNSLDEGWDINKFASINNTLREGSFNRGAETQLGGESVKWLLRASSNIRVTVDDCGSRLGRRVVIRQSNLDKYIGFSVVTPDGHEKLTKDTIGKYLDKQVMIRSPMYCKLGKTDYCKCCVGDRLASNPTALSSAISDYGSKFLYIFMQKMHGTNLELAKLKLADVLM